MQIGFGIESEDPKKVRSLTSSQQGTSLQGRNIAAGSLSQLFWRLTRLPQCDVQAALQSSLGVREESSSGTRHSQDFTPQHGQAIGSWYKSSHPYPSMQLHAAAVSIDVLVSTAVRAHMQRAQLPASQ